MRLRESKALKCGASWMSSPSAPCRKKDSPAAASRLARGTTKRSMGVSAGMGALGRTNAATATGADDANDVDDDDDDEDEEGEEEEEEEDGTASMTLKKCVGTEVSSGAEPNSG